MYLVFGIRVFQNLPTFFSVKKWNFPSERSHFSCIWNTSASPTAPPAPKSLDHITKTAGSPGKFVMLFVRGFLFILPSVGFFVGRICFSGGKNITIFTWLVSLKTPNRAWKIQIYQMGKALNTFVNETDWAIKHQGHLGRLCWKLFSWTSEQSTYPTKGSNAVRLVILMYIIVANCATRYNLIWYIKLVYTI